MPLITALGRQRWVDFYKFVGKAGLHNICFLVFTDCLTNNGEDLSNNTEDFLSLFNKTLACFEHNLLVSCVDLLGVINV